MLPLDVPPLRERRGDVLLLVRHFMEIISKAYGYKPRSMQPEVIEIFERYRWPGNIRELRNIVERMMIMTRGENEITTEDIPPAILQAVGNPEPSGDEIAAGDLLSLGGTFREAKEAFERAYLATQLRRHNWNISKTAEAIRLERSNLHKKIKQLNIQAE